MNRNTKIQKILISLLTFAGSVMVISLFFTGCSEKNPVEPEIYTNTIDNSSTVTNNYYVTNNTVVTNNYPDGTGFSDMIGDWKDTGSGGLREITADSYFSTNAPGAGYSWYYYAEIVSSNDTENYFVIKITNLNGSSGDTNYTKVYWKDYFSAEGVKYTYMAECWPQTNTAKNAVLYQSKETHISDWGDYWTNL